MIIRQTKFWTHHLKALYAFKVRPNGGPPKLSSLLVKKTAYFWISWCRPILPLAVCQLWLRYTEEVGLWCICRFRCRKCLPFVGFTQGGSEYYPGWPLVAQSNGHMILVNIQYRLSAYGFLNAAEIREDGAANAGLLDQRAALNWVQRHISKFGGDPSRVTINGGSAGGGSVTAQMILYGGDANPPFRAVIAGMIETFTTD
jgi:hypothetical protein